MAGHHATPGAGQRSCRQSTWSSSWSPIVPAVHLAVIASLVLDVRNEGKENLKAAKDEERFCR